MKLFCDMFIPYMPDKDVNDKGELVPSKQREAARNAMIELDNFQKSGSILCLYNAVFQACTYAEVDLIDKILTIPESVEIPEISIEEAVDMCARMLFQSVKPDNKFDIDQFVGTLLTAAHFGLETIRAAQANAEKAEESKDAPKEEIEKIEEITETT